MTDIREKLLQEKVLKNITDSSYIMGLFEKMLSKLEYLENKIDRIEQKLDDKIQSVADGDSQCIPIIDKLENQKLTCISSLEAYELRLLTDKEFQTIYLEDDPNTNKEQWEAEIDIIKAKVFRKGYNLEI